MEFSNRKKLILHAIISEYIKTAEPISSKALSQSIELSSATIRNEMSELEDLGYLEKQHTSSGRIPSTKGYRLYVDELMDKPRLPMQDVNEINKVMCLKIKELDTLISEVGKLISDLTKYTAVAITPSLQRICIKKFDIIAVDDYSFVIVAITTTGLVKNKLVRTSSNIYDEDITNLIYVLNQTLTDIPMELISTDRMNIVRLAAGQSVLLDYISVFISEILDELYSRRTFLEGASKILSFPEYKDAEKAQKLLDCISANGNFEPFYSIVKEFDGIKIMIGPESGIGPLSDASMIYASYNIGNLGQGIIGVVGPTRMDYGSISARLSLFAKKLNKLISESFLDE